MAVKITFNPFRDNFILYDLIRECQIYIHPSIGCCVVVVRLHHCLNKNNYLVEHLDSARLFCAYYMHAYGTNYVLQVVGALSTLDARCLPHAGPTVAIGFFGSDLNRSMVIMSMYRLTQCCEWQEHSFG